VLAERPDLVLVRQVEAAGVEAIHVRVSFARAMSGSRAA
jgi:hypothetical protein